MCKELGQVLKARLLMDASAALGVAHRLGVGRIRHLETGALWLQEQGVRRALSMNKVPGSDILEDALTGSVSCEVLERHAHGMNGKLVDGGANAAVQGTRDSPLRTERQAPELLCESPSRPLIV